MRQKESQEMIKAFTGFLEPARLVALVLFVVVFSGIEEVWRTG